MRWMNDDRGASGVLIAITITVLLGMAGLVVDVGAMYQERRELSNGADAAALAIAEDCALGAASCDTYTGKVTAGLFANENASDGAAAVDSVAIDHSAQTVTVDLSTLDPEGSTVLDPYFAEVVGFAGTTVHARAIAEWGYPSAGWALPLVISECEFPTGVALPTSIRTIYFHDGNNAEPCNAQAGQDSDGDGFLAGGFGWLTTGSTCESYMIIGNWYGDDPGASPSNGCVPADIFDLIGQEIPLPIFDDLVGVGVNGQYHISSFGLFQVTGFNFGGSYKYPSGSGAPCTGDERCISGRFTSGAIYEGEFGGPNRGFVLVKLIG